MAESGFVEVADGKLYYEVEGISTIRWAVKLLSCSGARRWARPTEVG